MVSNASFLVLLSQGGGPTASSVSSSWNVRLPHRSVRSTAVLGARAIYQDFDDEPKFGWDATQYGPLIGLMFHI